jgi:hypothetical protein
MEESGRKQMWDQAEGDSCLAPLKLREGAKEVGKPLQGLIFLRFNLH